MKILIFIGSVRDSSPPRPARLGLRVARAVERYLQEMDDALEVALIDPLDYEQAPVFKPHFAYSGSDVPAALDALAEKIKAADAYVMVSPEYNHSMSPALSHLLNHFGSSLFSWKPSAIITYSAGQWGGARAAIGMRSFLSELGCLPVSAMIHVAKAQEIFDDIGKVQQAEDDARWAGYFQRTLAQLLWWADAAAQQREQHDPETVSKAFRREPSQRNAPGQ